MCFLLDIISLSFIVKWLERTMMAPSLNSSCNIYTWLLLLLLHWNFSFSEYQSLFSGLYHHHWPEDLASHLWERFSPPQIPHPGATLLFLNTSPGFFCFCDVPFQLVVPFVFSSIPNFLLMLSECDNNHPIFSSKAQLLHRMYDFTGEETKEC